MGKTVAVLSGKGGTGKTFVTAMLSRALAEEGKKVLCIDMDFGLRGLEMALGITTPILHHVLDVCEGKTDIREAALAHPNCPQLKLLAAPQTKTWEDLEEKKLEVLLKDMEEAYDWIFLDGPAGIGKGAELCARSCREVLLVSLLEPLSLRAADKMSAACAGWGRREQSMILNQIPSGMPKGYEEGEWKDLVSPEIVGFLPQEDKIREQFQKGDGLWEIETKSLALCKTIGEYLAEPYGERKLGRIPRPDVKEKKRENSFIQKIYEALSNKKL